MYPLVVQTFRWINCLSSAPVAPTSGWDGFYSATWMIVGGTEAPAAFYWSVPEFLFSGYYDVCKSNEYYFECYDQASTLPVLTYLTGETGKTEINSPCWNIYTDSPNWKADSDADRRLYINPANYAADDAGDYYMAVWGRMTMNQNADTSGWANTER